MNDNHSNEGFQHEADEIRAWLKANVPDNLCVITGDRHWQYHSVHPETGVQEFSADPASDEHASGSPGYDAKYRKFHRVKGGFLAVTLRRKIAEKFREMPAIAAKEKKPFFINANICDPHRPFIEGVGKKAKADEPLTGAKLFKPHEVTVPGFLEAIPRVREEVAQYYSTVSRFDIAFGLIMRELTAAGLDQRRAG